jgi:hypothetical protein
MDLITPVANALAFTAGILSLGIAVMFVAVALARISLDFFKS